MEEIGCVEGAVQSFNGILSLRERFPMKAFVHFSDGAQDDQLGLGGQICG